MGLNPIETTDKIQEDYIEYLESMFFFRDEELMKYSALALHESGKFVKGPYIEVTQPFITGRTMNELMDKGIVSKEFSQLSEQFPLERPLYIHQERAITKLNAKKNIVVATGTGSGKTECFILPIINELMREKETSRLNSGVRALLLYPMNALANDQIGRLRKLLRNYPAIKFGRYTGETEEKASKAEEIFYKTHKPDERIVNEILSREEMRENPPHILLTNYAMLEYLLLRPKDNVFFDGADADKWKFIVLDEAHTYNGAKGTEISMLLQRLKQRISERVNNRLICIATSATLGGGIDAKKDVADFASDLFRDKFYPEDIIESERKDLTKRSKNIIKNKSTYYFSLDNLTPEELYINLKDDINVLKIQEIMQKGPALLDDLLNSFFEEEIITNKEKKETLIKIVDLCVRAKEADGDLPLLPARYHVFVKALEGAYVSLYKKKKIYLDRHKKVLTDEGFEIVTFELANCQRCGQEYIVGRTNEEGVLVHADSDIDIEGVNRRKPEYYMLCDNIDGLFVSDYDEDEALVEGDNTSDYDLDEYILCTACGKIEPVGKKGQDRCCAFPTDKYIKVSKVKTGEYSVNTCARCGNHSVGIVKQFRTADDPATEVLTRSLYQCIPTEENEISTDDIFGDAVSEEKGRKLLVFSDSRQEAAFFASFLQLKYNNLLWRNAILHEINELKQFDDIRIDSLVNKVVAYGKQNTLFDNALDDVARQKMLQTYLTKEFMDIEPQIGLEGLGLIAFSPEKTVKWSKLQLDKLDITNDLELSRDELWDLYCVMFDSLRSLGVTTLPELIDIKDKEFSPRNRMVYFKLMPENDNAGSAIVGWLPKESRHNRRSDFLKKMYLKKGFSQEKADSASKRFLKELLTCQLYEKLWKKDGYIQEDIIARKGKLLRINYKMWQVNEPSKLYICNKCGRIAAYNLRGVCQGFRCQGEVITYNNEKTRFSYYKDLYKKMKVIPMSTSEHTAQLTSEYASELQGKFERSEINVLSCSTTFEMGVDVGQLEAVFMRNVPPETANYIQRAGRAGRRTESTAFALTYAKRRSHDLTYYQNPTAIISGKIKAPYIELGNEKIVLRHVFSVVFAWFFRKYGQYFGTVDDFFKITQPSEENAVTVLKNVLKEQPEGLKNAITFIIPDVLDVKRYIDAENWGWVDKLLKDREGALVLAEAAQKEIIAQLEKIRTEYHEKRYSDGGIVKLENTYLTKDILSLLSSSNVLPKYGFPVDVVDLEIISNSDEASHVEISRDLKLAISEFAPGNEIVANKRVWKPYALKMNPEKGWPVQKYAICKICGRLYSYHVELGGDYSAKEKMCCGEELIYHQYVQPIFGFSTRLDDPLSSPGEKRKAKPIPSRVKFDTYMDEDMELTECFEKKAKIGKYEAYIKYSSRGKLVIVNSCGGTGYLLCKKCGYIIQMQKNIKKNKKPEKHKSRMGRECSNTYLTAVHLGHDFITDVVEIKLPLIDMAFDQISFWPSLLYAVIEGAAMELGISRNEIGGCLYRADGVALTETSIILYDDVPGGAGHVKKIAHRLAGVLANARQKVAGGCGCGEETSCYGCLRSFENQFFHEILARGIVHKYLNKLLVEDIGVSE